MYLLYIEFKICNNNNLELNFYINYYSKIVLDYYMYYSILFE